MPLRGRRASSLTAASALAALLEVQEIDADAQGRNRRAAGRYASAILDRLEALRVEVIGGQVSPARLPISSRPCAPTAAVARRRDSTAWLMRSLCAQR